MGRELEKLKEDFKKAAHAGGPLAFYDATVLDVNVQDYTCDVQTDEGNEVYAVRLRAIVSNNSSVDVLPTVGSAVVIGMLGEDDFMVVACDRIDGYRVTVGTNVLEVTTEGIKIGQGEETLQKILHDLVTAVLSIAAAKDAATLTQLLIRINSLLK